MTRDGGAPAPRCKGASRLSGCPLMGHWQQIAEDNRKVRAERLRWPWWRRHGLLLLAVPVSAVLWLLMLAPVWKRLL